MYNGRTRIYNAAFARRTTLRGRCSIKSVDIFVSPSTEIASLTEPSIVSRKCVEFPRSDIGNAVAYRGDIRDTIREVTLSLLIKTSRNMTRGKIQPITVTAARPSTVSRHRGGKLPYDINRRHKHTSRENIYIFFLKSKQNILHARP